jgi:hypothetical protein
MRAWPSTDTSTTMLDAEAEQQPPSCMPTASFGCHATQPPPPTHKSFHREAGSFDQVEFIIKTFQSDDNF